MRKVTLLVLMAILVYAKTLHVWYTLQEHSINLQIEITGKYSSLRLEGIVHILVYVDGKIWHKGRFVVTEENYTDDNILFFTLPKPPASTFKIVIRFWDGKRRIQRTVWVKKEVAYATSGDL